MAETTPPLRELNEPGRRRRDESIAGMMQAVTPGVDPARARAIGALARLLYGFECFRMMRERFQVAPEVASDVVAWAMRTLVSDLEKSRGSAGAKPRDGAPRGAERAARRKSR